MGTEDFDHLELYRFGPFLDVLQSMEEQAGIVNDGVDVQFSATLASYVRRSETRAVCVTHDAVHLLDREAHASALQLSTGSHKVLHTFKISDLITIIESRKDVNSVCLDFRVLSGRDKMKTILSSLPDPTYVLFSFKEADVATSTKKKGGSSSSSAALSEKDEFIAVLYFRYWRSWDTSSKEKDIPKGILAINDMLSLRTAEDAQRAISNAVMKEKLATTLRDYKTVDLIHAESGDKLGIARESEVVRALKASGDKKILVSINIQTLNRGGSAKADLILILTDQAIYLNEREQKEKSLRRVELQDVIGIVLEDNSKKKNDEERRWDVLLRLDLANDKSRDFPSDILFRCEMKHQRELLVRSIQSAYEDLVIDKLLVETGHNIKWGKRGKVEGYLSYLRGGQRKQLLDKRTEVSLRWLIFLFKHHLYSFVTILSDAVPQQELHFMGISIVSLCEAGGMSEKLLAEVVCVEMDDNVEVTTIFRGNNLACSILRAYVGHSVDEYLKVVLLEPLKAFVDKNPPIDVGAGNRNNLALWEWCDRFYDRITHANQVDAMPHEMRRVVGVINQACQKKKMDPLLYIGGYVMLRIFCPAISTPQSHNLLSGQQAHKARKLLLIARILQHLANKTYVSESREPFLAHAINWWLQKMSGTHRDFVEPTDYRYRGECRERVSWKAYVSRLLDKQLVYDSKEEEEEAFQPQSFHEIEQMISRPDFAGGWEDTRILAGLHKVLTKYTEQLLCLLWTETGIRKHRLAELEGDLAALEEDAAMLDLDDSNEGDSDLCSPSACSSQFLSPPHSGGSPYTKSPKSPLPMGKETREKREQFYVRRSSLWAQNLTPLGDDLETVDSPELGYVKDTLRGIFFMKIIPTISHIIDSSSGRL